MSRKLSAIMFTDIYGYSGLMSENEEKALSLLHDHDRILRGIIESYDGEIIKKMGDAIFASFRSSLDAFMCSEEIHKSLLDYNKEKTEKERIIVRIGLHAGDVIDEGNDLYGDGVNIAARLEPLADPGGTCLSETVFLSLRSSIRINAQRIENVELKNIGHRINIYRIPSVFGSEFKTSVPLKNPNQQSLHYRIQKISLLPPSSFGWFESILVSFSAFVLFDVFAAVIVSMASGRLIFNFFYYLDHAWLIFVLYNLVGIVALSITIKMRTIKVSFKDIRDVDRVLQFILGHIGFKKVSSEAEYLVFKPSSYNRFFWFARKMKLVVDGNSILIQGTDLLIRRLERVLKTYQKN